MLNKLQEYLKSLLPAIKLKLISKTNDAKIASINVMKALAVIAVLFCFNLKTPEMHSMYLRYNVGSRVYIITNSKNQGGGTGFAVKAPSGKTYIMTNYHVCDALKKRSGGKSDEVIVEQNNGKKLARKIIATSDYSDLCLIEGLPGVSGLSVGDVPYEGQKLYSVGHPGLKPRTVSTGDIQGFMDLELPEGPISGIMRVGGKVVDQHQFTPAEGGISEADCQKPKNRIKTFKRGVLFFEIEMKMCLNVTKDTYITNMLSQPGASGSPVVDSWGNVIGVLFAGDEYSWAFMVNANDVKQFLEMY